MLHLQARLLSQLQARAQRSCHARALALLHARERIQHVLQVEASAEELTTFRASKGELEEQLKVVSDEYDLAKAQMNARWDTLQARL